MVKKWFFKLKALANKLSIRAALFTLLALLTSLSAIYLGTLVPDELAELFGDYSVDNILSIMATSMLMVLTFSLSTMLSAYASANQVAPPRATVLIIEDSSSFSAFSILLGAFIYSMVSLIALSYKFYGAKGRVILMLTTTLVLVGVVWVLINWIEKLKDMGKVHETIKRVALKTQRAFETRETISNLGCGIFTAPPQDAHPLFSNKVGYVQNIDLAALSKKAVELSVDVYVMSDAGDFVSKGATLLMLSRQLDDECLKMLASCYSIDSLRTYDSDPRYGLSVLSAIASKALSPSLNDQGSAIDVVTNLVFVLTHYCELVESPKKELRHKNVYLKALSSQELLSTAFYGLIKDGIGQAELSRAINEGLLALTKIGDEEFKKASFAQLDHLIARTKLTQHYPPDRAIGLS